MDKDGNASRFIRLIAKVTRCARCLRHFSRLVHKWKAISLSKVTQVNSNGCVLLSLIWNPKHDIVTEMQRYKRKNVSMYDLLFRSSSIALNKEKFMLALSTQVKESLFSLSFSWIKVKKNLSSQQWVCCGDIYFCLHVEARKVRWKVIFVTQLCAVGWNILHTSPQLQVRQIIAAQKDTK